MSNVVKNDNASVFLVTPAAAQFGSIPVGQTSSMQVRLLNKSLQPVVISSIQLSGTGFSINTAQLPLTVASGASYVMTIQFVPSTTGDATGQITVTTSTAGGGVTIVPLSGTGTVASTQAPVPTALGCTPSGFSGAGTAACTVTLSDTAPSAGTIVALTSSSSAVTTPSTVTVPPGVSSASFSAQVAAVTTAQAVTLTASANSGSASTTLTLRTNGPTLQLNSATIAFGNVVLGETATQDLTLTSTGSAAVVVNSAMLSGGAYALAGASFPATLPPGQSATLSVTFSPTAAGAATGSLTIVSTSLTSPITQVALTGAGVSTRIALTWNAPTGATLASYRVYRTTSGVSSYALLSSVNANTTAYSDPNIASGETYLYYVTSVDSTGLESVPSNTATVPVP